MSKRAGVVIAAVLVSAVFVGQYRANRATTDDVPRVLGEKGAIKNAIQVSQRIVAGDDSRASFATHPIEKGSTALDLLYQTTSATAQGSGAEAFVVAIGDVAADEEEREFWAFYVNGELADVGAGSYELQEGDRIEWKLEIY